MSLRVSKLLYKREKARENITKKGGFVISYSKDSRRRSLDTGELACCPMLAY